MIRKTKISFDRINIETTKDGEVTIRFFDNDNELLWRRLDHFMSLGDTVFINVLNGTMDLELECGL